MERWFVVAIVLLSAACSRGASTQPVEQASATSSGGEGDSSGTETCTAEPARQAAPTVLAIPLPGIERSSLRSELQQLWEGVDRAVAMTPPDPPVTGDQAQIDAWASGPFTDWIRARVQVTRQAETTAARLAEPTPVERGLALALIAIAYQDMAIAARGMPVPEQIASDSQLLALYAETIDRALLPIAQYAALGFEGCATVFTQADDGAWQEWPRFCSGQLQDLREVFGRYARPEDQSTAP